MVSQALTDRRLPVFNAKQERFVQRYLSTLNATRAAVEAGYSAKTAAQIGSRLLRNVHIAAAIAVARAAHAEYAAITQEEIIGRLAAIVRSDIRLLYDERGALRPIHQLPDAIAIGLDSIDTQEVLEDGKVVVLTRKIKRTDRLRAAELLMRHMGMLNGKLPVQGDAESPLTLLILEVQGNAVSPWRLPGTRPERVI